MLYYNRKAFSLIALFSVLLLASCKVVVRNYPANKPFIFKNEIDLKGNISKDEKKRLQTDLANYWDDSLKVLIQNKIIFYKGFPFVTNQYINRPPVFDTAAITRSMQFMQSYLNSQGYYHTDIMAAPPKKDTVHKNEIHTIVKMVINANKNLSINEVSFDSLENEELRKLAQANSKGTVLRKNQPFSNGLVSSELDRLVAIYRQNGYYRLTRENLYAEVDTIDPALLEITLDPFEQAQKIAEAANRRFQNPTINVLIRQRPVTDSSTLKKYYTGWVYFYPDLDKYVNTDSIINAHFAIVKSEGHFTLKQNSDFIVMSPLRQHSYMREGSLYDEQRYTKTVNGLSSMGTWSQVDAKIIPRVDSPQILDYHFFMTPASKYPFGADLEVSRNSGSIIAGNLLGISSVFTLGNRNLYKRAIQSTTTIRAGVELGFTDTVLQTFQTSINQSFIFPRLILPWKVRNLKTLDDYKTLINFNASYTDRLNFFRLRSGLASLGWEWKKKNRGWIVRVPNIELYSLDTLAGLKNAFVTNPFLRTAFNTGYVVGENATFSLSWPNKHHPNHLNNFRVSVEESGAILGTVARSLKDKVYQYVKFETEFRKVIQWRKTALAFRTFGGIGINYSSDPVLGKSLPFFKQFVAGGPYSMRAWGVRQLGLGSSLLSDTNSTFRDRFGDIQLEANLEYRFQLFTIGSMKVNSAVFVDAGNIWNLKNDVANPGSKLAIDQLYKDIAIAAGIGVLRLDFGYFLIRLDLAYKVKDPARLSNGGWMSVRDFEWQNREFNLKDASGRELKRNNYSFQLGIGLPF